MIQASPNCSTQHNSGQVLSCNEKVFSEFSISYHCVALNLKSFYKLKRFSLQKINICCLKVPKGSGKMFYSRFSCVTWTNIYMNMKSCV